jgi:hypothetical protein
MGVKIKIKILEIFSVPYTLDVTSFFFLICTMGLWVLRQLLAYCTSPG